MPDYRIRAELIVRADSELDALAAAAAWIEYHPQDVQGVEVTGSVVVEQRPGGER